MKRLISLILIAAIVLSCGTALAAPQGQKGASQTAMEKASDEAVFHRVGDWFATIGKSPEEKKAIIAERKAKRATARAQKQARKAKADRDRKMKEMKKGMVK